MEIALKEATEFHDSLQAFVDWLTNAEKTLSQAKAVSRVMETVLSKIYFLYLNLFLISLISLSFQTINFTCTFS